LQCLGPGTVPWENAQEPLRSLARRGPVRLQRNLLGAAVRCVAVALTDLISSLQLVCLQLCRLSTKEKGKGRGQLSRSHILLSQRDPVALHPHPPGGRSTIVGPAYERSPPFASTENLFVP